MSEQTTRARLKEQPQAGPHRRPSNFEDFAGCRFGRLVAVSYAGSCAWLCRCDCGGEKVVKTRHLKDGLIVSCGCYLLERIRQSKTTHGQSKRGVSHAEYVVWLGLKRRCYCPGSKCYSRYGGRGISVCQRWLDSFEHFLADMGPRPSPQHSIDRYPDNNGAYEPGNCRWATRTQQGRNKRNNKMLEFRGRKACVAEWAEITGISQNAICTRLRAGWAVEDTLTRPLRKVSR